MSTDLDPRPDSERWLAFGRIVRAHGIRGELRCVPLSRGDVFPENLARVRLQRKGEPRIYDVVGQRAAHDAVLLRFAGVEDRNAAELLAGAQIDLEATAVGGLAPGEFFLIDLVGAAVVDEAGAALGMLDAVHDNGAQPLLVIRSGVVERLLPLIENTIVHWDAAARSLVVRTVPGLWDA